jgi:AcrR family transcriptional regulator
MSPRPKVAPERRAAIVRATIHCLARDGYAGLTMKGIATEAGVSPGILHYYFRDKRAILARAAARGHLRALLRACLRVALESRDFWSVFIELWGEALHDRELARLNRRAYTRARRFLARSVARGTAAGVFRKVSPDEAAAVILALTDGLSLQLTFDGDLMPLGRAVRLAEEVLTAYLAAPARPDQKEVRNG